jgi:SSS family solute:Na+ symporter
MTQLVIIGIYLLLLLALGLFSSRLFRGTSQDYMLASHSIGPFLLLMSLFGTTMTGFALVGSTGESFKEGIGVYGMLASSSGIVHSLCFFLFGVNLWKIGVKNGYTTQIQFFRERLESNGIGLLLFPVLVTLVITYLLIGVLASGLTVNGVTRGSFPELFADYNGGVPPWLASLVICCVVLTYVFFGGMRGTTWANTMQTLIFMVLGVVTFFVISNKLGGLSAATQAVLEHHPEKLTQGHLPKLKFLTYLLIPLSVGMFPHVFQHWLTAKSANSFKLPIVAHPIFIMIVWLPCVLVGTWATSAHLNGVLMFPPDFHANAVLPVMVGKLSSPLLGGFLTAGILAAIMSSLDSQFLCLGTMFTEDIAVPIIGKDRLSEKQIVMMARGFIIAVVAVTYGLSLFDPRRVFTLGIWCFSGFTALVPLVAGALYWKRLTKAGGYACVIVAIGSWLYFFQDSGFASNPKYSVLGMLPVAAMLACSTAAMLVVSLITTPPSDKTLAKFFPES